MTYAEALKAFMSVMQRPELKNFEPGIRYRPKFGAFELELRSQKATYRFHKVDDFAQHVLAYGVTQAELAEVKPDMKILQATQKVLGAAQKQLAE